VLAFQLDEVLGDHGDAGILGGNVGRLQGFENGLVRFGRGEHFPLVALIADIVAAGFEHHVHKPLFGGLTDGDEDLALALELPGDAALFAHISAILGEGVADIGDGAIAVVSGDIDQDGGAARPVAFEHDLFDLTAFEFAGAAHDGLLDVVGRHTDRFGGQDGGAQARIPVGVPAAARGDHDFLDNARERFSTLGVKCRLFVLNGGPFRVARHVNLAGRPGRGAGDVNVMNSTY
jgi:hypothetical protein